MVNSSLHVNATNGYGQSGSPDAAIYFNTTDVYSQSESLKLDIHFEEFFFDR